MIPWKHPERSSKNVNTVPWFDGRTLAHPHLCAMQTLHSSPCTHELFVAVTNWRRRVSRHVGLVVELKRSFWCLVRNETFELET